MRNKLVVWSGGLDSTLLLNDLAKESSEENPVLAVSFDGYFYDENKGKQEDRTRKNYLRYAKKKGYHIDHHVPNIKSTICVTDTGWAQQLCWFSFILPYIPDNCDLYFGFIQGDCIWLAINSFYKMLEGAKHIGDKNEIEVHFPHAYKKKWEILKEFQQAGIPENCFWTCEFPKRIGRKIIACEKCGPCISLQVAKFELGIREK